VARRARAAVGCFLAREHAHHRGLAGAVRAEQRDAVAALELLEATATDSAVAKYIEKRGPGLHHITLRVDDIRGVLAALKARGVRLVDEEPRQGAEGSLVAFVHPSAAHGVLVELKQVLE
jgi:methylmalonyl-CoA epimerase